MNLLVRQKHNNQLHRTNFTVTIFSLRGKNAASKICSVSRALHSKGECVKIYGDRKSGNCYKVQLVCGFLNIDHEWVDVDILAGDTKSDEFLERNPNGKISLLELDQ